MMQTFINEIPIVCINQAAVSHHVSAALLLAIMKKENGRNGQAVRNKTGSYDLGVFQVNTRWLPTLARYGYTRDDIPYKPCKNVMAASWILVLGLAEGKSVWEDIGYYNSHTSQLNKKYRTSVQNNYQKIIQVLET